MSPPVGWKHKVKDVACLDCGVEFQLKTHSNQPRCAKCRRKHWRKGNAETYRRLRREARRYRILLHHLGWEDEQFGEMVKEIRASPMAFRKDPESRSARLDLTWDRKLRRLA